MDEAFIRKEDNMGNLAYLELSKWTFSREIQTLASDLMQLGILKKGGVLTNTKIKPTFLEEIKTKKFQDERLIKLWNEVVYGEAYDATVYVVGGL